MEEQKSRQRKIYTLSTGAKHSDNCPVCGKFMRRSEGELLGEPVVQLTCDWNPNHRNVTLFRKSALVSVEEEDEGTE